MRDDGVIFVSIDDNEVHRLRSLMDGVFGEENFVGMIAWRNVTDNNPTLTRALARAAGKHGVCVNAVAPGLTRSESLLEVRGALVDEDDAPQIQSRAIPRSQYPEDIVGAVLFFLSDASNFITGQTLLVDGGSYMH